jgi:hypothetical protein
LRGSAHIVEKTLVLLTSTPQPLLFATTTCTTNNQQEKQHNNHNHSNDNNANARVAGRVAHDAAAVPLAQAPVAGVEGGLALVVVAHTLAVPKPAVPLALVPELN